MEQATRIRIAGLATALFIGTLSAAGVAVRADHATHAAVTGSAAAPAWQQNVSVAGQDGATRALDQGFEEVGDE